MFSACTSIKVAVLLSNVADLPKEHFIPLDPILYFQLIFLRLPCCCSRDLFILPAGTGKEVLEYPLQAKPPQRWAILTLTGYRAFLRSS